MICYYCGKEACAKIGKAKGNIWRALLGKEVWNKIEKYVCKRCHILIQKYGIRRFEKEKLYGRNKKRV